MIGSIILEIQPVRSCEIGWTEEIARKRRTI